MRKPDLLRETIARHVPELERDPYRLRLWVENGNIISRHGAERDLSWRTDYKLNGVLLDFAGSGDAVFLAILEFLSLEQPERLQEPGESFSFDVEIIDAGTVDLMFIINLSEQTAALRRDDRGFDISALPEPRVFPDDLAPDADQEDGWLFGENGAAPVGFDKAEVHT